MAAVGISQWRIFHIKLLSLIMNHDLLLDDGLRLLYRHSSCNINEKVHPVKTYTRWIKPFSGWSQALWLQMLSLSLFIASVTPTVIFSLFGYDIFLVEASVSMCSCKQCESSGYFHDLELCWQLLLLSFSGLSHVNQPGFIFFLIQLSHSLRINMVTEVSFTVLGSFNVTFKMRCLHCKYMFCSYQAVYS